MHCLWRSASVSLQYLPMWSKPQWIIRGLGPWHESWQNSMYVLCMFTHTLKSHSKEIFCFCWFLLSPARMKILFKWLRIRIISRLIGCSWENTIWLSVWSYFVRGWQGSCSTWLLWALTVPARSGGQRHVKMKNNGAGKDCGLYFFQFQKDSVDTWLSLCWKLKVAFQYTLSWAILLRA